MEIDCYLLLVLAFSSFFSLGVGLYFQLSNLIWFSVSKVLNYIAHFFVSDFVDYFLSFQLPHICTSIWLYLKLKSKPNIKNIKRRYPRKQLTLTGKGTKSRLNNLRVVHDSTRIYTNTDNTISGELTLRNKFYSGEQRNCSNKNGHDLESQLETSKSLRKTASNELQTSFSNTRHHKDDKIKASIAHSFTDNSFYDVPYGKTESGDMGLNKQIGLCLQECSHYKNRNVQNEMPAACFSEYLAAFNNEIVDDSWNPQANKKHSIQLTDSESFNQADVSRLKAEVNSYYNTNLSKKEESQIISRCDDSKPQQQISEKIKQRENNSIVQLCRWKYISKKEDDNQLIHCQTSDPLNIKTLEKIPSKSIFANDHSSFTLAWEKYSNKSSGISSNNIMTSPDTSIAKFLEEHFVKISTEPELLQALMNVMHSNSQHSTDSIIASSKDGVDGGTAISTLLESNVQSISPVLAQLLASEAGSNLKLTYSITVKSSQSSKVSQDSQSQDLTSEWRLEFSYTIGQN